MHRLLLPPRLVHSPALRRALSGISAALVKELREKSGAPMMDCKKALAACTDGSGATDIAKAMDWLRAKGISKAASSDRASSEGLIVTYSSSDGKVTTVAEINSETDFVSRNKEFQVFSAIVAATVQATFKIGELVSMDALMGAKPVLDISHVSREHASDINILSKSHATVKDCLGDIVTAIRENIVCRRASQIAVTDSSCEVVCTYVHGRIGSETFPSSNIQMGKTAAVISLRAEPLKAGAGVSAEQLNALREMGRRLAMHAVAASPKYLSIEHIPKEVVEQETAIFRAQTLEAKTPPKPEMLERIISGKVGKRLGEMSLLGQAHVAEEGQPVVGKHLEAQGGKLGLRISVKDFSGVYRLGGGLTL